MTIKRRCGLEIVFLILRALDDPSNAWTVQRTVGLSNTMTKKYLNFLLVKGLISYVGDNHRLYEITPPGETLRSQIKQILYVILGVRYI